MVSLLAVASFAARAERRVAPAGGEGENSSRPTRHPVFRFRPSVRGTRSKAITRCVPEDVPHFESTPHLKECVDNKTTRRSSVFMATFGALVGSQLFSEKNKALALVDEANAMKVFEQASKSVVALAEYTAGGSNGGYTPRGTGVVWADFNDGGFVVTSFHKVKEFVPGAPDGKDKKQKNKSDNSNAPILRVNVPSQNSDDFTWYDAVVVGTQRASDIAVLRLMRPSFKGEGGGVNSGKFSRPVAAPIGASEKLKVGQTCYVLGAGDGVVENGATGKQSSQVVTMSAGVVSGLRRSIPSKNGTTIRNVVQTDAEVTESNAGAALVDSNGNLIGIATTTYGVVSPGLGFAVPTEDLLKVVPALITLHQIS